MSVIDTVGSRLSAWLGGRPRLGWVAHIPAAALLFAFEVMVAPSFAMLLFSGSLAGYVGEGISMLLVGTGALCCLVALLGSEPGSIALGQDAPVILLALATSGAAMPAAPADRLATLLVMMAAATVGAGAVFVVLGAFRVGSLARFLPYPVMGGFLAGSGWLLLTSAVGVMAGVPLGARLLEPAALVHWGPGILLSLAMLGLARWTGSALALPLAAFGAIGCFYLVAGAAGAPVAELSAQGWLLDVSGAWGWHPPLTAETLGRASLGAVGGQAGPLALVAVVSVVTFMLNASGLELIVRRGMDLDRELIVVGVANIAAGLLGGTPGFHSTGTSKLNYALTGGRRLTGAVIGALFIATALLATPLFAYLPRLVLGGLLGFLGLSLLIEWVYEAWFRFTRVEFAIIALILVAIGFVGILEGIAIGMVAAILLFVVSYSRAGVVRHTLTGLSRRSRVNRGPRQRAALDAAGEQLVIMQLQGFLFFGTASALLEQVRGRALQPGAPPLRLLVLDFAHISGLDSTALLSFRRMLQLAHERRFTVALTGMAPAVAAHFGRGELEAEEGAALRTFADLDRAIQWCEDELLAAADADDRESVGPRELIAQLLPASEHAAELVGCMERVELAAGDYLIRQADPPDFMFFIASGQVTAQIEGPGRPPVRLETMRAGRTVGELAFYLGTARTASVVADEPCVAFRISRATLDALERDRPAAAGTLHRLMVSLLGERVVHLIRAVDALQR